jgi:hypothetical protein
MFRLAPHHPAEDWDAIELSTLCPVVVSQSALGFRFVSLVYMSTREISQLVAVHVKADDVALSRRCRLIVK